MSIPPDHRHSKSDDTLQPFAQALRDRVPSREALLAEAKALTRQRRNARKLVGASLLSVALLAGLWKLDPAWRSDDVHVALGQRQQLTLEDGSQVTLNSGSHLRIEHRLHSRQFELLQGQALFSAVHGGRPFIVRSRGVSVRDIGTVFDVRSDARGVQVGVIQGAIEISNGQDTPRRLYSGEQSSATAKALGTTYPMNIKTLTAWQLGKLRFDATPLSDVASDLQHYRQAPVRVADAQTGALRLSGEFDAAQVETLIQLLPRILPVQVRREPNGGVTLIKIR